MSIDNQISRAVASARLSVAPGPGASIVQIWRATATAAGGRDAGGNILVGSATSESSRVFLSSHYCRFVVTDAATQATIVAQQPVSGIMFTFVLPTGDNPQLQGDDLIVLCVQRTPGLTLAQVGWQANTAYATGTQDQPATMTTANAFVFQATTGGTTGSSEPTWPTTVGASVSDGSVVWTCQGPLRAFHMVDPGGVGTFSLNYLCYAQEEKA